MLLQLTDYPLLEPAIHWQKVNIPLVLLFLSEHIFQELIHSLLLFHSNQYRYVFGNVSSSDLVYELRPVTGNENAEFTINNNGYVKVEADKIIVAKANNTDTKYKVQILHFSEDFFHYFFQLLSDSIL